RGGASVSAICATATESGVTATAAVSRPPVLVGEGASLQKNATASSDKTAASKTASLRTASSSLSEKKIASDKTKNAVSETTAAAPENTAASDAAASTKTAEAKMGGSSGDREGRNFRSGTE
ncbi:unnamed protein product, partial [Laminaria digitata]